MCFAYTCIYRISKSLTRVQSNPDGKSFIIEATAGLSNVLLLIIIIIISSVLVCLTYANAKFVLFGNLFQFSYLLLKYLF